MDNPFSIMFGKEPSQMISRLVQTDQIINSFTQTNPGNQIYMITGVRGSGKTVLMTTISKRLGKEKDWVIIELNPSVDLLHQLASKLYNDKSIVEIFKVERINLSFWGIGAEIEKEDPITDIEVALRRMLENLKKRKKRVLITIDEAVNSNEMKVFASAFQIFVRQDLPVFLLMTGLQENIDTLQNNEILTFLHRAPKIHLEALDLTRIAYSYQNVFDMKMEEARDMAKLTRGYPYAFQVLGYYTFEKKGLYKSAIPECRQYLNEYVYDKIWSELSKIDKKVLFAAAQSDSNSVKDIRSMLGMEPNEFSPYRARLIKKGLISKSEYGYVEFLLPFFEDYILDNSWIEGL